jgi:flagellar biosynthesis/type III secretory pathway chaperone
VLTESRFSYLIEIAQRMLLCIQQMSSTYRQLPPLIDEEHAMIKSHTYTDRLESVMKAKVEASDGITACFEELSQLSQEVYLIWKESDYEGQAVFPSDLNQSIKMIENIHQGFVMDGGSPLRTSVLLAEIEKLMAAHREFKDLASLIKPKLEVNRTALTQIVTNYQMSTRALIEMCEHVQATYNPNGQQKKSSQGTSTIFVKA